MKKRNLTVMAIAAAALALSACGGGSTAEATTTAAAAETTAATTTAAAAETEAAAEGETEAANGAAASGAEDSDEKITGPFLITSCGQSPGAVMLNMVATQAGITSTADNALTADTFDPSGIKTLIVTAGTSGKGMGAAGTDVNAEIERVTAVMDKAREAGVTIVGAHIEGMARRTDQSDQASIDTVMGGADKILVIDESDSDGWFTNYATENNKPIIKVKDALSAGSVMQQ